MRKTTVLIFGYPKGVFMSRNTQKVGINYWGSNSFSLDVSPENRQIGAISPKIAKLAIFRQISPENRQIGAISPKIANRQIGAILPKIAKLAIFCQILLEIAYQI